MLLYTLSSKYADVAELVDALVLGTSVNDVGVRVPSSAPKRVFVELFQSIENSEIRKTEKYESIYRFIFFCFLLYFVSESKEMNLKVLKKGVFCDMIRIINKKIKMNKEIRSRIEWECNFVNKVPMIKERKLENCRTYKSCLCRTS